MTKILFFNYEYPPLGGGAANATAYMLREYAKIPDLEVDLVTSSVDEKYHLEKVAENVRVHKLSIGKNEKNLHFQSQKDLLAYAWKAFWFSRLLIKKAKKDGRPYDLTHSFFTIPCGFISLALKFEFRLPYIVSLRGSDVPGYSDRFGFIYATLTPLIKFIWRRSEAVIANAGGLRELALKADSKRQIGVIPNGIDLSEFKPIKSHEESHEFIITPGASRITARKGHRYLVEAISKLVEKYPQIRLDIIGDGNERRNLEKQVADLRLEHNVKFLGVLPHDKVSEHYKKASLFVLPSLNEGMSNSMLEALATGLPIITTDTGGTRELVTEGENGYIIGMKDADVIAEKIELLINDPELRRRMGEKSRRKAEELSWENVARKYVDVYKNIIESGTDLRDLL